jgi:hypothetical protein
MLVAIATLAFAVAAQEPPDEEEPKLPSGKSQREAILKADHEKSLRDVAQIIALAEEIKGDLEKNEHFVLSISSLKKSEEIEKLARRLRNRMKK